MSEEHQPYGYELEDLDHKRRATIKASANPTGELTYEASEVAYYKMLRASVKHGYPRDGWLGDDWEERWRAMVREHVEKGDPRDLITLGMIGWFHGWSSAEPGGSEP